MAHTATWDHASPWQTQKPKPPSSSRCFLSTRAMPSVILYYALLCIRESHCSHEDPHIPPAKVTSTAELQPWTGHARTAKWDWEAPNHISSFGKIRPRSLHQVPNGSDECGQSSGHLPGGLNSVQRWLKQSCCAHIFAKKDFCSSPIISQWSPCQNPRSAAQMGSCSPRIPHKCWHWQVARLQSQALESPTPVEGTGTPITFVGSLSAAHACTCRCQHAWSWSHDRKKHYTTQTAMPQPGMRCPPGVWLALYAFHFLNRPKIGEILAEVAWFSDVLMFSCLVGEISNHHQAVQLVPHNCLDCTLPDSNCFTS